MNASREALPVQIRVAVEEAERKIDYIFDDKEILDVLMYTIRKCEVNKKGVDYIPILFENELRDYVMRKAINLRGKMNREKRQRLLHRTEVAANV